MTTVPIDDRGLLLGDGLFETLLIVDGEPSFFEEHMARLARGCAVLGLPAPGRADAERALQTALNQAIPTSRRAAARITWSAGSGGRGLDRPEPLRPQLIVSVSPAPDPDASISLAVATVRRNQASPISRLKTLSYLDNVLARGEARTAAADEALMLNTLGEIACAAAANVFWLAGDGLFTPALDCGVLDGIMRARVIQAARSLGVPVHEVRAPQAELDRAEAIFLTNSLIGVRPVRQLDGRTLGDHALVRRLSEAVDP